MNAKIRYQLAFAAIIIAASSTATLAAEDNAALSTTSSANRQIDPTALARAQQKLSHAQQVTDQFAARADAEGLSDSWRMEMLTALMKSPESAFVQVQATSTARQALMLSHNRGATETQHASGASQGNVDADSVTPKVLGDTTDDLTFIPLAVPCRIVDTRVSGAGGAIAAGATREFSIGPSSAQGSSSCSPFVGYAGEGTPGAAAVTITVDAHGSTAVAGSYLQVFPDGGSTPTSWLNFSANQVIANAGILSLSAGGNFDITASASTNVIVDVFGSFIAPAATALDCQDTTKVAGTLSANGGLVLTSATCPAGYTIASGSCFGGDRNSTYSILESTATAQGAWLCTWKNTSATAQNVAVSSHCCRVPGR